MLKEQQPLQKPDDKQLEKLKHFLKWMDEEKERQIQSFLPLSNYT